MAINSLKLIGKTSNEIFILRYPNTLLDFCDFDFSVFAAGAIDICNEALKTGTPDYDRISDLRHDIQSAHCYIEHNIRTIYEKIVFDCWIDYVCRRDNIGVSGMWNRYIRCKTPFEKVIFARLCEFRYNRAVNEWLNIIRIQDYAKTKLDFIFTDNISRIEDAAARRNYFDLIFSVTSREMGCRIEDLGVTKIFSVGRIPTAPFMFPNLSKEIVRHVLPNFDYSDDYSDIGDYSEISDQIAMDAFSRMKSGLPQDLDKFNIPNGKLDKYSDKIYMPCSLKAAIDLEIDVLIEEGSWLSRCKRCKRFFLRNSEHPEEYCSRYVHNGKTCLQIYEEEHPRPTMTPQLEERCRAVTDEMYSRVDKTMSVKEYDSWHLYLEAMMNKVKNGEILPSELESFLDYSLEVDISKSRPIVEVAKKEPETSGKRVVKPFIPERISRSELAAPPAPEIEPDEEPELPRRPQSKEGFFTSPNFQRQKSERAPISHIIRNGESMGESYSKKPDPAGFTPFGAPERPEPQPVPTKTEEQPKRTPISLPVREEPRRRTPREELKRLEERIEEENRVRRELAERTRSAKGSGFKPFSEPEQSGFAEAFPSRSSYDRDERAEYDVGTPNYGRMSSERDQYPQSQRERERSIRRQQEQPRQSDLSLAGYGQADRESLDRDERGERFEREDRRIRLNDRRERYDRDDYDDDDVLDGSVVRDDQGSREPIRLHRSEFEQAEREDNDIPDASEREEASAPRRKVIRKNAAALSAYGKMSGTQFSAAPLERDTGASAKSADAYDDQPDTEPFKDIGSIFDVLEQSQSGSGERRRLTDDDLIRGDDHEPSDDQRQSDDQGSADRRRTRRTSQRSVPSKITEDNVPDGIWTEERNLFPDTRDDDQPSETEQSDSGKERKHTRSNKTQRLFDVIMREPDDNPNFRK
ncbi:MAG: hypothetical protein K2N56_09940 [Oscillospiraceae bacterium]|nr:hypothetical protein [Oscillospiraceae bacterium]